MIDVDDLERRRRGPLVRRPLTHAPLGAGPRVSSTSTHPVYGNDRGTGYDGCSGRVGSDTANESVNYRADVYADRGGDDPRVSGYVAEDRREDRSVHVPLAPYRSLGLIAPPDKRRRTDMDILALLGDIDGGRGGSGGAQEPPLLSHDATVGPLSGMLGGGAAHRDRPPSVQSTAFRSPGFSYSDFLDDGDDECALEVDSAVQSSPPPLPRERPLASRPPRGERAPASSPYPTQVPSASLPHRPPMAPVANRPRTTGMSTGDGQVTLLPGKGKLARAFNAPSISAPRGVSVGGRSVDVRLVFPPPPAVGEPQQRLQRTAEIASEFDGVLQYVESSSLAAPCVDDDVFLSFPHATCHQQNSECKCTSERIGYFCFLFACSALQFSVFSWHQNYVINAMITQMTSLESTAPRYQRALLSALAEMVNLQLAEISANYHALLSTLNLERIDLSCSPSSRRRHAATPAPAGPQCPHGPAKLLTVQKKGNNEGRLFYSCPKGRGAGCTFFKWADEINSSTKSSGSSIGSDAARVDRRVCVASAADVEQVCRGSRVLLFAECDVVPQKRTYRDNSNTSRKVRTRVTCSYEEIHPHVLL